MTGADGSVVTLADAPIPVKAGDLLGFVEGASGAGAGFLHFEIIAPRGEGDVQIV